MGARKAETRISVDEWRAALLEADRKQDVDGFTTREMAQALGRSEIRTQADMRKLFLRGELECAGTRVTYRMDGKPNQTPVYRFTKKKR